VASGAFVLPVAPCVASGVRFAVGRSRCWFHAIKATLALALLGSFVLACAPITAPLGTGNDVPAIEADAFLTRDGLHLPLRHWDATNPRAVIVALHGMGDYSEAFAMPGPWWAAHGITTFAYDQRGFGRSPHAGLWAGASVLRTDLCDFVDAVHGRYPGVPVYALGESMGGAVVLSALADSRPLQVRGVILAAPAVWAREDMPLTYRVALWLAAHTLPWLRLSGEGMGIWPSDNVPMLIRLHNDPAFQHSVRADQIYGLVNLMDAARRAPEQLSDPPPIFFLYGAHDQVIPKEPTRAVIAALGSKAETHRFPNGYHMLLRDLDAETVWTDIASWIGKTAGAKQTAN